MSADEAQADQSITSLPGRTREKEEDVNIVAFRGNMKLTNNDWTENESKNKPRQRDELFMEN